jgi:hypothetical protein
MVLSKKQLQWLDRIVSGLDSLPATAEELVAALGEERRALFQLASYGSSESRALPECFVPVHDAIAIC